MATSLGLISQPHVFIGLVWPGNCRKLVVDQWMERWEANNACIFIVGGHRQPADDSILKLEQQTAVVIKQHVIEANRSTRNSDNPGLFSRPSSNSMTNCRGQGSRPARGKCDFGAACTGVGTTGRHGALPIPGHALHDQDRTGRDVGEIGPGRHRAGQPVDQSARAEALRADGWPRITDQGIVLKRARLDGKPALVVGGGSPALVFGRCTNWWSGGEFTICCTAMPCRKSRAGSGCPTRTSCRSRSCVSASGESSTTSLTDRSLGVWRTTVPCSASLAKLKFNRILLSTWPYQPSCTMRYEASRGDRLRYGTTITSPSRPT